MTETPLSSEETPRIREMEIDDFPEVFHIGEEVFTVEYSQSLYRTWDEFEITTLFNSDTELCLVAEMGGTSPVFPWGLRSRSITPPGSTATWSGWGFGGTSRRGAWGAGCSTRSGAAWWSRG
jgi:hypothetical protein